MADDYDDRDAGDERDDYHDPPRFPGSVMAAGVIWVGVGALGFVNVAAGLAMQGGEDKSPASSPCCPGLVALAFLICGLQTVRGTASDTRGNGIGSIVFGGLQLTLAVVFVLLGAGVFGAGGAGGFQGEVAFVIAALLAIMGTALTTAGFLAIAGLAKYREWRKYHHPKPRRRRKREGDEDDDREPRPSRRDDD